MTAILLRVETKKVAAFLENIVEQLTEYVNSITIHSLGQEGIFDHEYLLELLKTTRRLLVFCEEGLEACNSILKKKSTDEEYMKHVLDKVYCQCIERFFHPKNDVWYENSRSSYSDEHCIVFRKAVPPTYVSFIYSIELEFQMIREQMEHRVQSQF
ncbi:DUF3907 domain-containing protein [Bacillus sp. UMB0899]|uniref:DUF3907 family protein n=1 Tax=Metabacillus schmidteae TaxID=2730405 RepID=UPI000C80A779|nr:DUF3907 family protein [Metabacillus schmidteae]PMC39469.1 DUF3907 domain-containing protein [Bacillus sp. UMB0899]